MSHLFSFLTAMLKRFHRRGMASRALTANVRTWRERPLLKFQGIEHYFKTGIEAGKILVNEAKRRDAGKDMYLGQFESFMSYLTPVFDTAPRYAWLAKIFLEPERSLEFRVSFLDDSGAVRTHRGYRVQYSSTMGPYEGPLLFGPNVTSDNLKSIAFANTFSNALAGARLGGAAGGANFDPSRSSDAEIQRFCQSYMTELAKYIGPHTDLPTMGEAVGPEEIGYLYGTYKRISNTSSPNGQGLLWGGSAPHTEAYGYAAVHFAKHALAKQEDSLVGKRCLVTGSGKNALAVAERLIDLGAIPLTLSDSSGFVYESEGVTQPLFKQLKKIKQDRGARIGRYMTASVKAKYTHCPIFTIPCDIVFAASHSSEIDEEQVQQIANSGCSMVVDVAHAPVTPKAVRLLKKLGILHAPYKATLAAGSYVGAHQSPGLIKDIDDLTGKIYYNVSKTAKEYNQHSDLNSGTNIASFLNIAQVMHAHGAT